MKKLLIVAPHFAPVNTPDGQRARIMLPYFVEAGYQVTVLRVDPAFVSANLDEDLLQTVPDAVQLVSSSAFSPYGLVSALGIKGLALRSFYQLMKVGNDLLQREKFDVIYFSTTVYLSMLLGPYWKKKFNIPYVVDYHDPWRNDYYSIHRVPPPGGQFKFYIAQRIARIFEPSVLKHSAHITVVSKEYVRLIRDRYPEISERRITYLPFGAPAEDFQVLKKLKLPHRIDPADTRVQVAYAGRVGQDMSSILLKIFREIATWDENIRSGFHLSFWGTDYATGKRARSVVLPLARECGVEQCVSEHSERIPYFETLQLLKDADLLLLFGSEDKRYSPSKLYPYLLADKPLVVLTEHESELAKCCEQLGLDTDFQRNVQKLKDSLVKLPRASKELGPYLTDREMSQSLEKVLQDSARL